MTRRKNGYKGFNVNNLSGTSVGNLYPYVSAVYGDYSKYFPPTLIQVGGKEIFLSNSIRMYRSLKENNNEVELDVYEGMWRVW